MRTIEQSTPASTTSLASRRADLERYEAQVAEWTALIGQYRAGARRLRTPETEWEHEKAELEQAWQAIRFVFRKAKARF